MDQPADPTTPTDPPPPVNPQVLRRVFALSLLPLLGLALFALGSALELRAFAHNTSLDCGGGFTNAPAGGCSHYSYWIPGAVGVAGLLLAMLGGAYASYYAARHVGLPVISALQVRRRLAS